MGTNYYLTKEKFCPVCWHGEKIHIGKNSFGWTFCFSAADGIRSYKDWITRIEAGGTIVDEYGAVITLDQFKALVESKRGAENNDGICGILGARKDVFLDEECNAFVDNEFD